MKSPNQTQIKKLTFIMLTLFLLFSCSGPHAVALMDTDNIESGRIYKIKGHSFKKVGLKPVEYYILEGEKGSIQEMKSVMSYQENLKKAKSFALEYKPMATLYARATHDHKIRPTRNINSRPYRMPKGQIIKILKKDSKPTIIDGIEGYWYEVLSADGYRGFSFSYRLEVFDKSKQENNSNKNQDFLKLSEILQNRFYPMSYQKMLNENRINLKAFNDTTGLRLNLTSGLLIYKTEKLNINFSLDSLKEIARDRFYTEDKNLYITLFSDTRIQITFSYNNNEYDIDLTTINQLSQIAQAEKENRATLLASIQKLGTHFKSQSYGELTITETGAFTWSGYDHLVPSLIPKNAGKSGHISFELYMNKNLESKYDDALYFVFKGSGKSSAVSFFIILDTTRNAIKLISIPKNLINNDNLIERDNKSPMNLFFKAENSQ